MQVFFGVLSAFVLMSGVMGSAHGYVNLEPVSYRGTMIVANNVNPTDRYLRCNLMETGIDEWGRECRHLGFSTISDRSI